MEPASKVSVPLSVVMRTRSRVPPSASEPFVKYVPAPSDRPTLPAAAQVLPVCKVNTILPWTIRAADQFDVFTPMPKPDVNTVDEPVAALIMLELLPKYPEVVTLPAPI